MTALQTPQLAICSAFCAGLPVPSLPLVLSLLGPCRAGAPHGYLSPGVQEADPESRAQGQSRVWVVVAAGTPCSVQTLLASLGHAYGTQGHSAHAAQQGIPVIQERGAHGLNL